MLLLLACTHAEPDEDTETTAPADTGTPATAIDATYGVVDTCDQHHRQGFSDFYDAGEAVLVVGDDDRDAEMADRIVGWYGDYVDLTVRTPEELTDEERAGDLFVFGDVATNALLGELNGHLPVWFEDDRFTFGGYAWTDPGNGIAMIAPSPWADDAWITLYAGNTFEGAYSTFTIPTGGEDVAVTRGRGVPMMEGGLCADDTPWAFYADWVDDFRVDWDAWKAQLDETVTDDHVFRYLPDSDAAADVDTVATRRTESLAALYDWLRVQPLDEPIVTYLYPDNATKGEVTGDDGNAHANDLNVETHEVYGDDVDAATGHEDVHVVAWYRIGDSRYALMSEGLAVAAGGEWWGRSLDYWAGEYAASGDVPALRDLVDAFWDYDDGVTYPLAGHFVLFLADGWGIDAVERIYVADDLDDAFLAETGLTTDELDAAWRATFPS